MALAKVHGFLCVKLLKIGKCATWYSVCKKCNDDPHLFCKIPISMGILARYYLDVCIILNIFEIGFHL